MATLIIWIPDDKHLRLKQLAEARDISSISFNKQIEKLSTIAVTEFDNYSRFKIIAARGDAKEGLRLFRQTRSTYYQYTSKLG